MPVSAPSVDNDLLSSLGETLLAFEHLFDTRNRGVSPAISWAHHDPHRESGARGHPSRGGGGCRVEVAGAEARDRKPAILLAFSRFWKPNAQTSTFLETVYGISANLAVRPLFGYSKRQESQKQFPKT